jgi:CDP-diacylglycerol pyrophosphatase
MLRPNFARSRKTLLAIATVISAVATAASGGRAIAGGPFADALWLTVHDLCVPNQQLFNNPLPCSEVDIAGGTDAGIAVVSAGPAKVLLVPTRKISGIESPLLLASGAPDYWAYAWQARKYLVDAAGSLSRSEVALAVNSVPGRSQDQLHIHIGCIRAGVRRILLEQERSIGDTWARLGAPLVGRRYLARRLESEDLSGVNVFKLVAASTSPNEMSAQTVVVVGATFKSGANGFYILKDEADLARHDFASGSELLDSTCRH